MLFDCYHQQISEGDLSGHIRKHKDLIGYYQVADHPGRHEPGTGEMNYAHVFRTIHDVGYSGAIGLELSPEDDPNGGFQGRARGRRDREEVAVIGKKGAGMTERARSPKGTIKKVTKKAAARPGPGADKAEGESAVIATIAAMTGTDRALCERLHEIIKANAPALSPKLWYGMPAYARDGKVVCFFQSALKFKTRYATLGFMHEANLDEGPMWPTAFALKALTAAEEAKIVALVKKAVS